MAGTNISILISAAIIVWLALITIPAGAGGGSYKSCDIANGQIFSCGSWHQGPAVAYHDGAYRQCDIANGQIFSCGSWHQGPAVAYHDGAYRQCDIANGQIFSCGSWHQGKAVVYTAR